MTQTRKKHGSAFKGEGCAGSDQGQPDDGQPDEYIRGSSRARREQIKVCNQPPYQTHSQMLARTSAGRLPASGARYASSCEMSRLV